VLFLRDRAGFCNRLRQIFESHQLSAENMGEWLGLDAVSIECALAGEPTLSVIVAVVREFAVDPTWLLTGEYNAGTHRSAIDDPARAVSEVVRRTEPRTFDGGPDSHAAL
jgi:hypothetical protein